MLIVSPACDRGHPLAADVRSRDDGALHSMLVQFEPEFQRVEHGVIEAEIVDTFPTLPGKPKMPFAVRFGGAQNRNPPLGEIGHCQVWDGRVRRIKNNTLDLLSRL